MNIESADVNAEQRAAAADVGAARGTDLVVPPAMAIIAAAAGTAGYMHFGLMPELAAAMALSLFCILLLAHVLLRAGAGAASNVAAGRPRSAASRAGTSRPSARSVVREQHSASPAAVVTADASRRQDAAADTKPTPRSEPPAIVEKAARDGVPRPPAEQSSPRVVEERVLEEKESETSSARTVAAPPALVARHLVARPLVARPLVPRPPALEGSLAPPAAASAQASPSLDQVDEQTAVASASGWDFRPERHKLDGGEDAHSDRSKRIAARDAAAPTPVDFSNVRPSVVAGAPSNVVVQATSRAAQQPSITREADRVEGILKRLASQIRGEGSVVSEASKSNDVTDAGTATRQAEATAPASGGDHSLATAVNALRSTVAAMRSDSPPPHAAGSLPQPSAAEHRGASEAVSAHPPISADVRRPSPAELRLAAVAEALAVERAEICLEPILTLAEDRAQHFEVSVRLKSVSGDTLDARRIIEETKAVGSRVNGSGLLPLLDAISIRHSAGFALNLERRGRDGQVFSEVAGESLQSSRFVSDLAGRGAQGIADRLVLAFAQDEVQGLGPAQFASLKELSRLGFRFALQGVSHLDMDFEALKAAGFEFVKLDAAMFEQGLSLGGSTVPARDLCRYFAGLSLAIIVDRIQDEATRARILGFGVIFGQGALFGAPRPIAVAGGAAAAPAAAAAM